MASTVKVPLIGQANKGTVIGVTIGGFAVAGFLIYRQQKKAKAAAANAQATQAAAAASGYGYGAGAYGYGAGAYPQGFYGYGDQGQYYGYGASGGFYPQGYYGYGVTQPPGVLPNTTNAQWAQAAITQLGQEGYNEQTVSGALGAYELGQPVNQQQVGIIDAAIAVEGYPPVPGASGYPPNIRNSGTPGGGQGGGTVHVPFVTGERADSARQQLRQAGLKYNIGDGAQGTVVNQNPKAGTTVKSGSSVNLTLKTGKGLMG